MALSTPVPPSQINIDGNCTIRNFPASNPLTSNISFLRQQPHELAGHLRQRRAYGQHVLQLNLRGTRSGSSTARPTRSRTSCQNLLIPVEKINKQNPAGQTTAAIGVPFTYKLTIPVLFDPATGTVINANGSPNDLHGITVWDDLNATGADLSFVSHVVHLA